VGRGKSGGKDRENTPMVWTEVNLEVLPIFRFISTKRDSSPYSYETVVKSVDGSELRKEIKVVPSGEYGAPGVREMDVVVAIFELVQQRGGMPANGEVVTSRSELLTILGWTDSGTNFQDLKSCLLRIRHTTIESRDAFYSKETESYITDGFEIFRTVRFEESKRRSDGRTNVRIVIRFHELVIRSFFAQYLKGLDTKFYRRLRRGLSKRLYKLIDQKRGEDRHWSEDVFELQAILPIGPYRYPSKIKDKVGPAAEELKDKGFLEEAWCEGNEVHFLVSERFARRRAAFEVAESSEAFVAMEMLLSHGLTTEEAKDLVVEYGPRRCVACVQAMPFQNKVVRIPRAWLRWAIPDARFDPYVFLKGELGPGEYANDGPAAGNGPGEDYPDADRDAIAADHVPVLRGDPRAGHIWEEVLARSAEQIDDSSLRVWFEGCTAVGLDADTLSVAVPNSFAKEYIETRFKDLLKEELRSLLSPAAEIDVVVGKVAPQT
jgi:hypothetical protein